MYLHYNRQQHHTDMFVTLEMQQITKDTFNISQCGHVCGGISLPDICQQLVFMLHCVNPSAPVRQN
jgi:hypothetical protein